MAKAPSKKSSASKKTATKTTAHKKASARRIIYVELRKTFGLIFADKAACVKFAKSPRFEVEFRPQEAQDNNKTLKVSPDGDNPFVIDGDAVSVVAKGKKLYVEVGAIFSIEIDGKFDDDDFDMWADDNSAVYCWEISPICDGWEMDDDFSGGESYIGTKNAYGIPVSEFV